MFWLLVFGLVFPFARFVLADIFARHWSDSCKLIFRLQVRTAQTKLHIETITWIHEIHSNKQPTIENTLQFSPIDLCNAAKVNDINTNIPNIKPCIYIKNSDKQYADMVSTGAYFSQ